MSEMHGYSVVSEMHGLSIMNEMHGLSMMSEMHGLPMSEMHNKSVMRENTLFINERNTRCISGECNVIHKKGW